MMRWRYWQVLLVCLTWMIGVVVTAGALRAGDHERALAEFNARPPVPGSMNMEALYISISYPAWQQALLLFALLAPPIILVILWLRSQRRREDRSPRAAA